MGPLGPDGMPTCPGPPDKVDIIADQLDAGRLRFVRTTTPERSRLNTLLARAERLE